MAIRVGHCVAVKSMTERQNVLGEGDGAVFKIKRLLCGVGVCGKIGFKLACTCISHVWKLV